jgi:hypothetical protein
MRGGYQIRFLFAMGLGDDAGDGVRRSDQIGFRERTLEAAAPFSIARHLYYHLERQTILGRIATQRKGRR